MNNLLNFKRLVLILKRYFIENKHSEIMYWGILVLVFTLIHKAESAKIILYVMGFIFAAKQFKLFAYTPGGMHYLLIPATQLEKLASAILLTTVYYFPMFILSYSIGNIVGTTVFNMLFSQSSPVTWEFFNSANAQSLGNNFSFLQGNQFLEMIVTFITIQSVFLLGSIFFRRNPIGRTMLSLFVLFIVLGIIETFFFKGFFGGIASMRNMSSFSFNADNSTLLSTVGYGFKIFGYLLIPFFWTVTYFRLTEKQV